MTDLETVVRNPTATRLILIDADPAALRECADRIEATARGSSFGESIVCPLTRNITVIYKPQTVNQGQDVATSPIGIKG